MLTSSLVALAIAQSDSNSWGLEISPNGRYIAAAYLSNTLHVVDLRTGNTRALKFDDSRGTQLFCDPEFSRDGRMLTVGSWAPDWGVVPVWSTRTWRPIHEIALSLNGQTEPPSRVRFSPNTQRVYTQFSEGSGNICAIDLRTGYVVSQMNGFVSNERLAFDVHPRSDKVVLNDARARSFDQGGNHVMTRGVHGADDVLVSRDGRWIACLRRAGNVTYLLRTSSHEPYKPGRQIPDDYSVNWKLDLPVRAWAWYPDNRRMLVAGLEGRVMIVDLAKYRVDYKFVIPNGGPLRGCAVAPNGKKLYIQGEKWTQEYDASAMKPLRRFKRLDPDFQY